MTQKSNENQIKKELVSQLNFLFQSPKVTDEKKKEINKQLTVIVKELQKLSSI